MPNGDLTDNATAICNAAVDILRACAEGAGSGPFASRIDARRRLRLLKSAREVARLVRAKREAADEHCRILIALVDELVARGLSPGDRQLRDLLLPIAGRFSDLMDVPRQSQSVLRKLCRHQTKDGRRAKQTRSTQKSMPEVATLGKLLEGRSIVMIGGLRNPTAERKLKDAFHLKDLHWIETREHQSLRGIETTIGRMEVAVAVLLIKVSSHSYGPQIRKHCREHGTPLVRLRAGYNPIQVAAQIMRQCGERLRAMRFAEVSDGK